MSSRHQPARPVGSSLELAHRPDPADVARIIARRSFATLATVSPAGHPHVAAVVYEAVGSDLYVSTARTSRKGRNLLVDGRVGVCIPVRRVPVGPPSTVQFQSVADVLAVDDAAITSLLRDRKLKSITSHGELDLADGCFLRIAIPDRVVTYGIGMSLAALAKDPLAGGGQVAMGA